MRLDSPPCIASLHGTLYIPAHETVSMKNLLYIALIQYAVARAVRAALIGVLLAAVLMQAAAIPLIQLSYDLNKTFIAASLCENRDEPALHCDGKCHLKKQLSAASDTEAATDTAGTPKSAAQLDLFWLLCNATGLMRVDCQPRRFSDFIAPLLTSASLMLFKPPQA